MYSVLMSLQRRERKILLLLARFGQLTALQIHRLAFSGLASKTPCYRALDRLNQLGLIDRIPQRVVGGAKGGSGQYVHVLSAEGSRMTGTKPNRRRTVDFHGLAVADVVIALMDMQRAAVIRLAGLAVEDEAWLMVGGVDLRPDLRTDIDLPDGRRLVLWLEIDQGTENQKQLRGKLAEYVRAYEYTDADTLPVFPLVLWIGVDQERAKELSWLVSQLPKDAQQLFEVTTQAQLSSAILSR